MARRTKASVEKETVKRVDVTLRQIEKFLQKWESAKIRPGDMLPDIKRLVQFRDALQQWKKDAGKSKGEADKEKLIREFVLICRNYS